MIPLLRAPKPPQKLLIQHIASKRGKPIYQDVEGINEQGKWYLPDSVKGRKLRSIQTGKYFNFTGVEDITFSKNITSIIGWFDSGSGWDEAHNFSADISGAVFTPTGKVARLDVTFTDASKAFLYCDEQVGLVARDALTISGNNGTIDMGGSVESSFHATSPEVPNVQNEIGYQPDWYVDNSDKSAVVGTMNVGDTIEFTINTVDTHTIIFSIDGDSGQYAMAMDSGSPSFDYANWDMDLYVDGNLFNSIAFGSRNALYELVCDGVDHSIILVSNEQKTNVRMFFFLVTWEFTGFSSLPVHKNLSGQVIKRIESYIPIAQDGDGKTDVLGNTVPFDYYGQVRYEGLIKGSSCLTPDGNITLTHPDLTGIVIDSWVGSSTPTKSGNDILMTAGDLLLLNLDNGESYDFRETKLTTTYERDEGNALTINLNGSAAESQWGGSDEQTPWNLLNGYWIATLDLGVKYPYNVGGDKTFVPQGRKTENTFNRNPFDAPALVAAGIPNTENISYEDITSDKSRFYDNAEENRVISLLTYSDFVEPFAGSVFQGDNNISFTHPDLSGITIISWVGTATPTKSGNDILVDTGTLLELILSDGSKYIWSEETGLIAYDLLKLNNFIINLNGSALGTQYTQLANKDYHHNLLHGYAVGGVFDGIVSGKFSEPNNTDSAWQIQGFKVEIDIIISSDTGSQVLFANSRYETGEFSGFIIVQSIDQLFIGIAKNNLVISIPFITYFEIVPDTPYSIIVSKRPNSAVVNITVNGAVGSATFSSATIYYSSSGQSVTVASRYNHNTSSYDLQTPSTVKKLRVTQIDDDDNEIAELINTDWINGDDTDVPNIADDAPSGSDMVFVDGTGSITGLIPGDPANFGFDVEGSKIDDVVLAKVKKYRRIINYLRR